MASRTQIVCLCEGAEGTGIDKVFINRLIKTLKPNWIRVQGSNIIRIDALGNRVAVIKRTPDELRNCLKSGSDMTLMVWADCDDDCASGEELKRKFWNEAERAGITKEDFDRIVFIFAKDRIENWIQFLNTGQTNEAEEGPRVKYDKEVRDAAEKLADICKAGLKVENMPSSLQWSCKNWKKLVERMKTY